MTRWVRLYEGMATDPKWRVVKARASQSVTTVTVGDIVAVFSYMLSNADINGNLDNWDDEVVAAALEYGTDKVHAIREAMQGKVLDGNHLKAWEKRQPRSEDNSTKRVRAFRERSNGPKRSVTVRNAPEEKRIEIDIEKKVHSTISSYSARFRRKNEFEEGKEGEEFGQFWTAYGHKLQRRRAEVAFASALEKAPLGAILAGVENYHRTRPAWQQIALAASWLTGERWTDVYESTNNGQCTSTADGQCTSTENGQSEPVHRTPEQKKEGILKWWQSQGLTRAEAEDRWEKTKPEV